MDFANERYVRLYTRDTTTTKLLGWQGRTVLWHLLRKLDRSGVLELEGCEPWEVAALHGDLPEDIARDGMARLLNRGCLVHDGDRLVAPRYIEANETPASDALRARESRERRAALSVTKRDGADTIRDAVITERDQTSRSVTSSHAPSRDVTPCRAVPNRADPSVLCRAAPSDSHARTRQPSETAPRHSRDTRETLAPDPDLIPHTAEVERSRVVSATATTEAWRTVHSVASLRATWTGDLSSEKTQRSCERVIEKAKETSVLTNVTWQTALDKIFVAWYEQNPKRLRLPNWPQRLLEDWHDTVMRIEESRSANA